MNPSLKTISGEIYYHIDTMVYVLQAIIFTHCIINPENHE